MKQELNKAMPTLCRHLGDSDHGGVYCRAERALPPAPDPGGSALQEQAGLQVDVPGAAAGKQQQPGTLRH